MITKEEAGHPLNTTTHNKIPRAATGKLTSDHRFGSLYTTV